MTAQDLKNSILQLAIQGKLVEQRVEEGTAKELVEKIKAEKEQPIKEKKIKKEKSLPEISEDEIPFEIPESWEWVRLQDVAVVNGGFAFKSSNFVDDGIRVVRISDFNGRGFVNNKIVRHPYNDILENYIVEEKDILLCMTGGTVGKSLFVTSLSEKMVTNQRVATIKISKQIVEEYVNYLILSPVTQNIINESKNSTNDNISMDTINSFLLPLPPIEEQKRIVEKIEELLPYMEQYDKAYSKLEVFNKKFPEDMQKSILQYAIQGKLVEQRPEEGTAEELYQQIQAEKERLIKEGKIKKEKPLSEITEEEIPFEIPESWKWVYINEICFVTKLAGFEYTKYLANAISSVGDIPIVRAKNIKPNKYIENETEFISTELSEQLDRSALNKRCVLMTFIGAGIGEVAIFEFETRAHLAPNVAKIVPHIDINDYILFYLMSDAGRKQIFQYMKQTAQPSLSMETIRKGMIPLPPLAEQKRIVKKVKELLPYAYQLVK